MTKENILHNYIMDCDTVESNKILDSDIYNNILKAMEKYSNFKSYQTCVDFMDSLKEYIHESGTNIAFDERESSEFVDIFFKNIK
jgi:phytoene/squalene synthetase